MASENFTIRLFTPQGLALEEVTSGVKLPSAQGEIGFLPEHIKYVGLLGTGVLEYTAHPSEQLKRIAIAEGLCTFGEGVLTVLADRMATRETTEFLSFDAERDRLTAFLAAGSLDDPERVTARKDLAYLEAVEAVVTR